MNVKKKLIVWCLEELVSSQVLMERYFLMVRLCHRCMKCVIWVFNLIVICVEGPIVILLQLKLLEVWEFSVD